jgi:hypothetical protein
LVGSLNGQSWKSVFRSCLSCCLAFKPSLPAGGGRNKHSYNLSLCFSSDTAAASASTLSFSVVFHVRLRLRQTRRDRARVLLRPGIQSTPSPKLRSFDLLLSSHHARHLPRLVACSCASACKHTLSPAHPLPLTILSSAHPSCRVCVRQHPTTPISCRIR